MHTVIQLYISQPESIGYTFCMSIFVKILEEIPELLNYLFFLLMI